MSISGFSSWIASECRFKWYWVPNFALQARQEKVSLCALLRWYFKPALELYLAWHNWHSTAILASCLAATCLFKLPLEPNLASQGGHLKAYSCTLAMWYFKPFCEVLLASHKFRQSLSCCRALHHCVDLSGFCCQVLLHKWSKQRSRHALLQCAS